VLVGPHPAGGPESGLDLVEQQRHVVDPGEDAQPPEEARAGHPDPALALDRLGQDGGAAQGASQDVRGQACALLGHERLQRPPALEEAVDAGQLVQEG